MPVKGNEIFPELSDELVARISLKCVPGPLLIAEVAALQVSP